MATYKVQSGDTLWGIAQKLLGNGALWPQLGYSGDPNKLAVGTVLNVPTNTSPTTAKTSTPTISAQSYYNHNPAGQVATTTGLNLSNVQPVKSVGTAASTGPSSSGGGSYSSGVSYGGSYGTVAGGSGAYPSPDFSGVTSAPSIPGFSFDWTAAEKEALEKLTPYYQEKLALAGGDVELAKKRIEEDYATGKRYRDEDLTSQTQSDDLQKTLETRDARAGLNSRGTLTGQMDASETGAAPESNYAQQYVMNPLRQQQDARRLAIQRAITRQEELAGTTKSRGLQDQDIAFDKYKNDLQEEKQEKAITQMAPMAYQQAYDKYLATVGRSIQ